MTVATDDELLRRLRNGEMAALAALYDRHKGPVYRYAVRLAGESAAAEDAIHDAFAVLCARPEEVSTMGGFRAWLFTVVRNFILMGFRRKGRTSAMECEDIADETTPSRILERKELETTVKEQIGRLKSEYRDVLLLREYDQLSYAEIAAITGATESSVRSRLFKARKALAAGVISRYREEQR